LLDCNSSLRQYYYQEEVAAKTPKVGLLEGIFKQ